MTWDLYREINFAAQILRGATNFSLSYWRRHSQGAN